MRHCVAANIRDAQHARRCFIPNDAPCGSASKEAKVPHDAPVVRKCAYSAASASKMNAQRVLNARYGGGNVKTMVTR
jgi:ribosomal protein L40E